VIGKAALSTLEEVIDRRFLLMFALKNLSSIYDGKAFTKRTLRGSHINGTRGAECARGGFVEGRRIEAMSHRRQLGEQLLGELGAVVPEIGREQLPC
jgi:hypothetical protein